MKRLSRVRVGIVLLMGLLSAIMLLPGPSVADAWAVSEAEATSGGFDCADVTQIPQVECEALVAFYYATGGDNWYYDDGWLVTNTPCDWYGITCDTGHVTELAKDDYLVGSIPLELANLEQLTVLSLRGDELSGVIPPELGVLSQLESFELGHNDEVSIPPELGNLSNLQTLHITPASTPTDSGDQLRDGCGTIPPELGNLSSLQTLIIRYSVCGTIPPELGDLSNLEMLYLGENNLTGSIPPELGNLSSLTHLDLSWSLYACLHLFTPGSLSGSLPPELGNLTNLMYLNLFCQSFTGPIPPQWGNLSNLEELKLGSTLLSGPLPPELGNLSALISIDLSYQPCLPITGSPGPLDGPLPPELGNLSNLEYLNLSCQSFSGPVPMSFINLLELQVFHFWTFGDDYLCEPPDPAFQAWIEAVPYVYGTGVICEPTSQQLYLPQVVR